MARRNFTTRVCVEIKKRARTLRSDGQLGCEKCGAIGVPLEVHHKEMDAMQVDKSRKLTADDGELLCKPCHDPITAEQRTVLAKVLRIEAVHLGVKSDTPKIPADPNALRSKRRPSHEGRSGLPPRSMYEEVR